MPSILDFQAASFAATSDLSVTLPGGAPSAGDLLVAIGGVSFIGGSLSANTGWTLIDSVGAGNPSCASAYKICGAGESATQTPLHNGGGNAGAGAVWRVTDFDSVAPIDAHTMLRAAVANPPTVTNTVSIPNAGGLALGGAQYASSGQTTQTIPTGWVQDAKNIQNTFDIFAHLANVPVGAGSFTWSGIASSAVIGTVVVVAARKPAFLEPDYPPTDKPRRRRTRYTEAGHPEVPVLKGDNKHVIFGDTTNGYGVEVDFYNAASVVVYVAGVKTKIGTITIPAASTIDDILLSVTAGTPNTIEASIGTTLLTDPPITDGSLDLTTMSAPVSVSAGSAVGIARHFDVRSAQPHRAALHKSVLATVQTTGGIDYGSALHSGQVGLPHHDPQVVQGAVTGYYPNLVPDSGFRFGAYPTGSSDNSINSWISDVVFVPATQSGWALVYGDNAAGVGGGNAFSFVSLGSGTFTQSSTSSPVALEKNKTYTLSTYIDATKVTSGTVRLAVYQWNGATPGIGALVGSISQTAGTASRISGTITTPSSPTTGFYLFRLQLVSAVMASAKSVLFGTPQCELGSALTAYTERPFGDTGVNYGSLPSQATSAIASRADANGSFLQAGQVKGLQLGCVTDNSGATISGLKVIQDHITAGATSTLTITWNAAFAGPATYFAQVVDLTAGTVVTSLTQTATQLSWSAINTHVYAFFAIGH